MVFAWETKMDNIYSNILFLVKNYLNNVIFRLLLVIIVYWTQWGVFFSLVLALWYNPPEYPDAGTYAALSYIHGYLKTIIPVQETQSYGGLVNRIKRWKETNEISDDLMPCHKLFILIPKSCQPTPKLDDGDWRLEDRQNLPPETRDRAGIREREYNNTVYKLQLKDKRSISVVAEFATSLRTFHEALHHHPDYLTLRTKFTESFYATLTKEVMKSQCMKKLTEFILYDDSNENVGVYDVLCKRLVELNFITPTDCYKLNEKPQVEVATCHGKMDASEWSLETDSKW